MTTFKKDEETGETLTRLNFETGELEHITSSELSPRPRIFRIPSGYIKQKRKEPIKIDSNPTFSTAFLFLLPTAIFFYSFLALVIVVLEAAIHIWAHKKNKQNKNPNVYYQSPLQIICKEFCGVCKEEESKLKISKFYEKRADRIKKYELEYLNRIVM